MAVFETGNPQTTSSIEHATQSSQMAGSIPIFCRMVLLKSVLFRLKSQCLYIYRSLWFSSFLSFLTCPAKVS